MGEMVIGWGAGGKQPNQLVGTSAIGPIDGD